MRLAVTGDTKIIQKIGQLHSSLSKRVVQRTLQLANDLNSISSDDDESHDY